MFLLRGRTSVPRYNKKAGHCGLPFFCMCLSYFPSGDNILYSFPYFWVNLFLLQYRGEE